MSRSRLAAEQIELDISPRSGIGTPLAQGQAARIVGKPALAMQEAHARGVVYHDLKPSNEMIDSKPGSTIRWSPV